MALKGVGFARTPERQEAFVKLKSCLLQAPILCFPTNDDRFILDTDASSAVGGVLNQLQGDREVGIAYASHSLAVPATLLYHTAENVGGCYNVYSFAH